MMKKALTWLLLLCVLLAGCSSVVLNKNPAYSKKLKNMIIIFDMNAFNDSSKARYADIYLIKLKTTLKNRGLAVTVKKQNTLNLDAMTQRELMRYDTLMFMSVTGKALDDRGLRTPTATGSVRFKVKAFDIKNNQKIFEASVYFDDASTKISEFANSLVEVGLL
jgi:hypothetical protein